MCETNDCLKSAANVVGAINRTFDPCQDFWHFACNGWITKNAIPENKGSWSVTDQIKNSVDHELRHYIDLIDQDVDEADPQLKSNAFILRVLTSKILNIILFRRLNMKFKRLEAGVLLSSWSYQSWDRTKVIERLHTKYGVTPYFKVSVGPDDLDPNQPYIIKVTLLYYSLLSIYLIL